MSKMIFLVPFFAMLFSRMTLAASPSEVEVVAAKKQCEIKYNVEAAPAALKVAVALAQDKCKLEVDVFVLQTKAQASGQKNDELEKRLSEQKASIERMNAALERLEKARVVEKPVALPTAPTPTYGAMPPPMMPMYPARPVPPTNLAELDAATTWDAFGGSPFNVRIYSIGYASSFWFHRAGPHQRVIVKKNGKQIAVSFKGATPDTVQHDMFLTDLNHDKRPDAAMAKGLDPSIDTIYVGYQPGDIIQLVYLVPVSTVGPQIVWGDPKILTYRSSSVSTDQQGRYQISAGSGIPVW